MDRSETLLIAVASILVGVYGGWGESVAVGLLKPIGILPHSIERLWPLVDVAVVTVGCLFLIQTYKRLRIGCYPSTFLYCFIMPEESNPTGDSQVLGFCRVAPNMRNGEITVEGASFFWDNGRLKIDTRVGFKSTQVRGTEENGEVTCHIQFNIDKEDLTKRLYRHGHLQFRLSKNGRPRIMPKNDVYTGYLRSTRKDAETKEVEVRAKGCAEFYRKGLTKEEEIHQALEKNGEMLFLTLDDMLSAEPPSDLWKDKDRMDSYITNVWGHVIPKPQSVILNRNLYPYIDRLLNRTLGLIGLNNAAIDRFKECAVRAARRNEGDTLVAYERQLKRELSGLIVRYKSDLALTQRSELIFREISQHLDGETLLDIGCGNGMISNLAKSRFKEILMLDVVRYVPSAFNLNFEEYKEGSRLPIHHSYDTVLLLTVLHHSRNPVELLKLAWQATGRKLIIIESVIGIHEHMPSANYELLLCSDEDQIAYAAFVDWFYNRVLHDNVPVPYNFTTPERWTSVFLENKMRLSQTTYLGQDVEIGPEYHVLYVLEKERG